MERMGRTDLPPEQKRALRSAIRWEWITIGYTCVTIVLIALVMGGSQAMKTAWVEDILSLIPQISFLLALLLIRRPPTKRFPYGLHRAMGVGHLVAGVALVAIGGSLAVESILGLVRAEHPAIGTIRVFGQTVWLGWLMVAVMGVTVVGPFVYGHAKGKIAPTLHNKVLYADADMAKADWTTTAASIVGVLGIGVGWWWLDGAAATFISVGIVWDGFKNTRSAVLDLMDQRARSYDDAEPHELAGDIMRLLESLPWVAAAGVRVRDMGQVFHVEAFVRPMRGRIRLDDIERARSRIAELDWKVQDIQIVPVQDLPQEASVIGDARPAGATRRRAQSAGGGSRGRS